MNYHLFFQKTYLHNENSKIRLWKYNGCMSLTSPHSSGSRKWNFYNHLRWIRTLTFRIIHNKIHYFTAIIIFDIRWGLNMSHHISTRFCWAFAKIHITQGKYFCQKLQNAPGDRIFFCYPAPRHYEQNHSFPHTRYLRLHFWFNIVGWCHVLITIQIWYFCHDELLELIRTSKHYKFYSQKYQKSLFSQTRRKPGVIYGEKSSRHQHLHYCFANLGWCTHCAQRFMHFPG